jgi:hypothetical protein
MHPVHSLKHSGVLQRASAQSWAAEGRFELETACPQLGAFIIEFNP